MMHPVWLPILAVLTPRGLGWGVIVSLLGVTIFVAVIVSIRRRSRNAATAELRTLCTMLGLSAADRRVLMRATKACHQPSLHPAALTLSHGCFRHARSHAQLAPADIARLDGLEGRLFPATAPAQHTAPKPTVADRSEPRSTTAVRSAFSSTVR